MSSNLTGSPITSAHHVFGNDLIFRKIAGYLGVADLKILRQTSKFILDQMNSYGRLINCLQVTVCQESIELGVVPQSTFLWKKAKLILEDYPLTFQEITCLRHLEDLDICSSQHTPIKHPPLGLCELLLQLDHLKSLSLPVEFLKWKMVIPKISKKLMTLESFCIHGEATFNIDSQVPNCEYEIAIKNWEYLGSLEWNLTYLQVGRCFPSKPFAIKSSNPNIQLPGVGRTTTTTNILWNNTRTLETLKLNCNDTHIPLRGFEDLIFPSLKSIAYHKAHSGGEAGFATFLRNQPNLESIDFEVSRVHSRPTRQFTLLGQRPQRKQISTQILDAIKEKRCQLKSLSLHGTNASWWEASYSEWEFLQDCGKLKEFQMPGLQPLIHHLPSDLKSLQLLDLRAEVDEISFPDRFPHLTQLKLTSSTPTPITDDILQSICRTKSGLRVFHLETGFANLTDFGLTGERADGCGDSGISLRNLKGLRDLKICGNGLRLVTGEGLVKAIHFQELRLLDLAGDKHGVVVDRVVPVVMTEADILQIAQNNPSLEYLNCPTELESQKSALALFRNVWTVNKRLTTFGKHVWPNSNKDCKYTHTSQPSYGVPSFAIGAEATLEFCIAKNEIGHSVLLCSQPY